MGNEVVVGVLAALIRRYDLVVVQEIRDASGTAAPALLDRVNAPLATDDAYRLLLSARLGHSSSKEQYGYFYRARSLTPLDSYHFNDTSDVFSREPFNVLWEVRSDGDRFATIPNHVTPDRVPEELAEMPAVYEDVAQRWGVNDTVILGDFNADCSYLSAAELATLTLFTSPTYTWLLDSAVDTTVSATDCAYDRVITTGSIGMAAVAAVVRFDLEFGLTTAEARDVSDHYPVLVVLDVGDSNMTATAVARGCTDPTAANYDAAAVLDDGACRCMTAGTGIEPPCDRPVWINELHYQNAGVDSNERVELAGPVGTDVGGWVVHAVNGATGQSYARFTFPAGSRLASTPPPSSWGFAVATFRTLQNGPDAIALVTSSGELLQFISYGGGTIVGTAGAVIDVWSTAIGVVEPASASVDGSLQLVGAGGAPPEGFVFVAFDQATFGFVNSGQELTEGGTTGTTGTTTATTTAAGQQIVCRHCHRRGRR